MSRAVTLAGYAVLAATAVAYRLAGLVWPSVPTLGDVVGLITRRPAGRALLLLWWLWVGWHFFVRSHVG